MRASNKARELSGNREPTSHGSRDRVLSEAEDAVEEEQVSKMTQLLNSIGMGQYAEMLDDVSVGQLMHMSDAELATLGIGKSTHRKIIAAGASYYGMALT